MAEISIIVPVYKAQDYICKCVESIISQTFADIEIILVDDGSPDRSGEICDELAQKDRRIKVIHKPNGGVSSARNKGIESSTGKYILFVDSDDWVEKDYVQSLVDVKKRFPESEPMCGFRTVLDYNGTLINNVLFSNNQDESVVMFGEYMELVIAWLAQSPCNKLFNKEVIDSGNIRFIEKLSLGEDMYFCFEYYEICGSDNIRCINRPLYNYIRTEKESLDNKYYPDILEIDDFIYKRLKKCIISWGANEEQMNKYFNSRFYRFVAALDNTYKKGNSASPSEKKKTNNKILKSKEFKEAILKVTSRIHPIHKFAYKSGNWNIVKMAYKITSLKSLLKRKK